MLVVRKASLFNDPAFRFHETVMGRDRLGAEIDELHAEGFPVQVMKRKRDARLLLAITVPDQPRLVVIPPVEYPINPPRVFELPDRGEWDASRCAPILHWNSDRRIVEIVRSWRIQRSSMVQLNNRRPALRMWRTRDGSKNA